MLAHIEDDEPDLADVSDNWLVPPGVIRIYANEKGELITIGCGAFGAVYLGSIRASQTTAVKVGFTIKTQ